MWILSNLKEVGYYFALHRQSTVWSARKQMSETYTHTPSNEGKEHRMTRSSLNRLTRTSINKTEAIQAI